MYSFKRKGIVFRKGQTLEFKKEHVREFVGFLRPNICLLIAGMGISGFLLFNPLNIKLLYVALATFFVGATSYSYNLITDKEEDLINHKKVNWFVTKNTGYYLVLCFLLIGFISVLFLSYTSMIFYISAALSGAVYSYYKIKDIFPLKNIYTGMSLTQAFMIGAANVPINMGMLLYTLPLFLLLFVASLMSDLRDYKGDKAIGIRTVPVVLGYEFTKMISYATLIVLITSVFALRLWGLLPLLIFVLPISILIYQNKPKKAHLITMTSFMCLPGGIFLMQVIA